MKREVQGENNGDVQNKELGDEHWRDTERDRVASRLMVQGADEGAAAVKTGVGVISRREGIIARNTRDGVKNEYPERDVVGMSDNEM